MKSMSSVLPIQPLPEITHASVVDNECETTYRRAGQGSSVLLLASAESAIAASLFGRLARTHRVYLPTIPSSSPEGNPVGIDWLRGFLDALGLSRVAIVADEGTCAAAMGTAMREPYRISHLMLLLSHDSGAAHGPIPDALEVARVPLLTVWHTSDGAEATFGEIERFLAQ